MKKFILAATAALSLTAPLAAAAQDVPSYAQVAYSGDDQIRGRIESFDGGYQLAVRDERGFVDNVQLHQGTIINPTGLTLEPGMVVSIIGANDGPVLEANEIDTPYNYDAGVPYYAGRAWNDFGPSLRLAFFFGNTGWWHGNDFGNGAFRYDRGVRIYSNVHVRPAGQPYVAYRSVNRPAGVNVNVNLNANRYVAPRNVVPAFNAQTTNRTDGRRYENTAPVRTFSATTQTTHVERSTTVTTSHEVHAPAASHGGDHDHSRH